MTGYIRNCLVMPRGEPVQYKRVDRETGETISEVKYEKSLEWGSSLFMVDGDDVYCQLDGYAIIPMEQYEELINKDESIISSDGDDMREIDGKIVLETA